MAYVVQSGEGETVVAGKRFGATFENAGGFVFNATGTALAYLVSKGSRIYVMLNGRALEPLTEVPRMHFSADGRRFIFSDAVSEKVFVAEGQRLSRYKYLSMQFGASGNRSAYLVLDGNRQAVLLDGVKGPTFGEIYRPAQFPDQDTWDLVFDSSGQHVAYTAKAAGKVCVIVDHNVTKACHEGIVRDSLQINSSGTKYAYVGIDGQKQEVVFAGERKKFYDEIAIPLVMNDQWTSLAYSARTGKSWILVHDGATRPYEVISNVVLSPDGRRSAFIAGREGLEFCVVNGVESGGYDVVTDVRFSPDGTHAACTAGVSGKDFVVLDGKRQPESYGLITDLVFSPDGKRVAFAVRDDTAGSPQAGSAYVVLGSDRSKTNFDGVLSNTLVFSDDGSSLGYIARVAANQEVVVVNGHVYGPYREIIDDKKMPELTFVPGTTHSLYRIRKQRSMVLMVDGIELASLACMLQDKGPVDSSISFYACTNNSVGRMSVLGDKARNR